jgi:hypothetical protein
MPWEISIVRSATDPDLPLGTRQEVIGAVSTALPGVSLECPPLPPKEIWDSIPAIIQESFLRKSLEGLYEGDEFSIRFFTSDSPQIRFLCAEVRGNGDPIPILAKLCVPNGWLVISDADKSVVELDSPNASQWDAFRNFRDKAIQTIRGESSEEE